MDIKEIFVSHRRFFNTEKTRSVAFRIKQLNALKDLLKRHEDKIYEAIYQDLGRSAYNTYLSELSLIYQEINLYVRNIRRWSKRKRVWTNLANFPAKSYIIPEPLGVTLVIGAWNYPYQLSLLPALSSLAAGNTVILKPSELSPATSALMATLINQNFPKDYFTVVEGGVEKSTELLAQPFDKIFFTGSTAVGKIVYQAAAKHLTPVTLELGGKSPAFVFADCDLDMTAKRLVWAKFFNAGQTCVAPDYILVERPIEKRLLSAMKKEIIKYYDIEKVGENYTRIINDHHFDRLHSFIENDHLFCGGIVDKENRFISPTILQDISFDDRVMKEEIFGPILPVIAFSDLYEATYRVREGGKPLACYVYSKSDENIDNLLKTISFGGGAVNDSMVHLSNSRLPFGGVGHSGIGSYHGKAGFNTFTHYKSILRKALWFEPSLKYPPYTGLKTKLLRFLLG